MWLSFVSPGSPRIISLAATLPNLWISLIISKYSFSSNRLLLILSSTVLSADCTAAEILFSARTFMHSNIVFLLFLPHVTATYCGNPVFCLSFARYLHNSKSRVYIPKFVSENSNPFGPPLFWTFLQMYSHSALIRSSLKNLIFVNNVFPVLQNVQLNGQFL